MPLGSFYLGERALEFAAYREYARMVERGRTILVGNAGNCPRAEVSWVHFVHASWNGATVRGAPIRKLVQAIKKYDARSRERTAFRNARLVITNSDLTCSAVKQVIEVDSEKVTRKWFGATEGRSQNRPRQPFPPLLAFVGALGFDTRTGLDIALRAFAELARSGSFVHRLVVAGFGSSVPWRRLARDLGIAGRVDFVAFVEDVPELLSRVDLLLSPARYEPYGLAVQEAIMEGVPPLVSAGRIGIIDRLPANMTDLIVQDPENPERWAQQIRRTLANLEDYRERTRALSAVLAQRTWEDFADDFIDTVESRLSTSAVGGVPRIAPAQPAPE